MIVLHKSLIQRQLDLFRFLKIFHRSPRRFLQLKSISSLVSVEGGHARISPPGHHLSHQGQYLNWGKVLDEVKLLRLMSLILLLKLLCSFCEHHKKEVEYLFGRRSHLHKQHQLTKSQITQPLHPPLYNYHLKQIHRLPFPHWFPPCLILTPHLFTLLIT